MTLARLARARATLRFERFIASGRFFDAQATFDDLETATRHGLVGPWASRLPGGRTVLAGTQARFTRGIALAQSLVSACEAKGIPVVILKGATAAQAWATPSLRPQADVDLLVSPAHHARTLALWARERLTAKELVSSSPLHSTVSPLLFPELPVELHQRLSDDFPVGAETEALLARRVRLQLDGVSLPALEAVDAVAHLALHAAAHVGARLVWLFDLLQVEPLWAQALERAREWGVSRPVAFALAQARYRLGPPQATRVRPALASAVAAAAVRLSPAGDSVLARALRLGLLPPTAWARTIARKSAHARRRARQVRPLRP